MATQTSPSYFNRSLFYLLILYLAAMASYTLAMRLWVEISLSQGYDNLTTINRYSLTMFLFYLALIPGAVWADKARRLRSVLAAGLVVMTMGWAVSWFRPAGIIPFAIYGVAVGYGIFLAGLMTALAREVKHSKVHPAKFFWLWLWVTALFQFLLSAFVKFFLFGHSLVFYKLMASLYVMGAILLLFLWKEGMRFRTDDAPSGYWQKAVWAVVSWGLVAGLYFWLQQYFALKMTGKEVFPFFWHTGIWENIMIEGGAALVSWFLLFKISGSLRGKIILGISLFIIYTLGMLVPLAENHTLYLIMEWVYRLSVYMLFPLFYMIILSHLPESFYGRVLSLRHLMVSGIMISGSYVIRRFSSAHQISTDPKWKFTDGLILVIIAIYMLYLVIVLNRKGRKH